MSVELNHTIVRVRDKHAGAAFLAGILGLRTGAEFGPFVPLTLGNGVSLDYLEYRDPADFRPQHYAFLVDEAEFDAAFGRIREAGIEFYADPGHQVPHEINRRWGGRGVYFEDPDGHNMELLTRAP
ncbi:VOC family protein [Streptomyces sp. NPDC051976]|jgi:catechol 2,3-dioxygenase-like lactoylglutathione lyase family enzyme|uniref:VOC family protein n=1 Tax=Streptomyces sp. NPDC051976 TaxID=3154947 RepID=UPI0034166446